MEIRARYCRTTAIHRLHRRHDPTWRRRLCATEGVYGARFSGAGFRGCCVALVAADAAVSAAEQVRRRYAEARPELAADAPVLLCDSDDGACILEGNSRRNAAKSS
ncbi:MAG TPA: hypothetical protein DIC52_17240 [Candidatus Latescibacteria bacterium]|nr:hypothetical protein [Candidatus Latescibacterota bacterium]